MRSLHEGTTFFNISLPTVTIIVSVLPAFGTVFAIVWSVLFNFDEANRTHCNAYNFLPSISAAIGEFTPQKYVWRICIALHCAPRFLLALSYYGYHTSIHVGKDCEIYKSIAALCSSLYSIEILSLVVLSYVSSSENFEIHKVSFCVFIFCSNLYMLLTCYLMSKITTSQNRQLTSLEKKSFSYKKRLFVVNISAFILCLCFYVSHNSHCRDRIYSYFAICEYVVIFSNIAFHATAILDFRSKAVIVEDPRHLKHAADILL